MPGAPNPVYSAATKTFINDLMIVRVPLLSGEGEIFFAKKINGKDLEVLFFRRVGTYDNVSKNFTGYYESINMTNYVYHKIDYINGIKVGEFKSQSIKSKSSQNSGVKTFESDYKGSWLGALWYCISNYIVAVPKKQSDGGWKCYGPGGEGESQPQNPQAGDAGGGGLDENLLAIIFPPHPKQPDGQLPSPPTAWDLFNFTPGGGLMPGTGGSNTNGPNNPWESNNQPVNLVPQNYELMSDEEIFKDQINSFFTDNIAPTRRPSFDKIVSNSLPSFNFGWESVAVKIGGEVEKELRNALGHNTCATRVSYALNYSGTPIPSLSITFTGTDKKHYIVGALTMLSYLIKSLGTDPKNTIHMQSTSPSGLSSSEIQIKLSGKKGIYALIPIDPSRATGWGASGHVDVLKPDGTFTSGHSFYSCTGGVKEVYLFILD